MRAVDGFGSYLEWARAAMAGQAPPAGIAVLLGFRFVHAEPGRVVLEMDAGAQHANPMGTLHGGVLGDIADAAMGSAYACALAPGETFTTMEMSIRFIRPVWTGTIRAEGRVVHQGRVSAVTHADVTDQEGKLVATASSTCLRLAGAQAAGR